MADQQKAYAAYNRVRNQLTEIGLLADGIYLDRIELCVSGIPSLGEAGFVYDSGVPWLERILGYQEGVIYLLRNTPHSLYTPGGTLTDVIRHEFAHAWAWLDRDFIDGAWFRRAFGRCYGDEWAFGNRLYRLFSMHGEDEFRESPYFRDFVSPYALKAPHEDFVEPFMSCLRYWGSVDRFKNRPGLYRKILAARDAMGMAARRLRARRASISARDSLAATA
jgi:hypothetical protein